MKKQTAAAIRAAPILLLACCCLLAACVGYTTAAHQELQPSQSAGSDPRLQWRLVQEPPPPPHYVGANYVERQLPETTVAEFIANPQPPTTMQPPSLSSIETVEKTVQKLETRLDRLGSNQAILDNRQKLLSEDMRTLRTRSSSGIWIMLIALTLIIVAIILPLLLYLVFTRRFFAVRQYTTTTSTNAPPQQPQLPAPAKTSAV